MKKHQKNLTKIITTSQGLFDLMSSTESGSGNISEELAEELLAKIESFKLPTEELSKKHISSKKFEKRLMKKVGKNCWESKKRYSLMKKRKIC